MPRIVCAFGSSKVSISCLVGNCDFKTTGRKQSHLPSLLHREGDISFQLFRSKGRVQFVLKQKVVFAASQEQVRMVASIANGMIDGAKKSRTRDPCSLGDVIDEGLAKVGNNAENVVPVRREEIFLPHGQIQQEDIRSHDVRKPVCGCKCLTHCGSPAAAANNGVELARSSRGRRRVQPLLDSTRISELPRVIIQPHSP